MYCIPALAKHLPACLTALLLISFSLPVAQAQSSEQATTLLQSIRQRSSVQATFVYTHTTPQDDDTAVTLAGQIAMSGQQYRLVVGEQTVISDGKAIWTYLPAANEVQITAYDPEQGVATPWDILRHYHQEYKLASQHTQKIGQHTHVILTLVAKDTTHLLPQITLTIDPPTQHLKRLVAIDRHQDIHSFDIIDCAYDVDFDQALFTFREEDYPGVEAIDMR